MRLDLHYIDAKFFVWVIRVLIWTVFAVISHIAYLLHSASLRLPAEPSMGPLHHDHMAQTHTTLINSAVQSLEMHLGDRLV